MGSWDVRVASESRAILAIGKKSQVIRLGDTPERRRLVGHIGGVPSVDFSPDGKQLVTIGKDRTIRIWDVATGKAVHVWAVLDGPGQALAFHPNGRLIVSAEWGSTRIRLRSTVDASPVLTLQEPPGAEGATFSASFSHDGRSLAATGTQGLHVWELHQTGDGASVDATLVRRIEGSIWAHQFDSTGSRLGYLLDATDDKRGTYVLRMDSMVSEPRRVFERAGSIQWLGFVNGENAFTSINGSDHTLEVWKPEALEQRRKLPTILAGEARTGAVNNVRASPDGAMIATTTSTGRGVIVIDTATGRRLLSLPDEQGSIWWLAWSPDSTRLAVSRSQGEVSIWNITEAQAVLLNASLAATNGPRSASESAG